MDPRRHHAGGIRLRNVRAGTDARREHRVPGSLRDAVGRWDQRRQLASGPRLCHRLYRRRHIGADGELHPRSMRVITKGITPMSRWPSRGTGLAAVVVAIVAGACATVPATVPASGTPAPSPAVTTPSMVAPTPLTAPVSTIAPTARSEPPAASISVEGGDPV